MIRWAALDTPATRWAALLDEIRAEQPPSPHAAAPLFTGSRATAARYRRRLEAGLVPSTAQPSPLDTSGLRFIVRCHGRGIATLYGRRRDD